MTAGKKFAAKYSSAHLPEGSTLYLQWQVGSKHVWKRVLELQGASGTATAPGVRQGKYAYRVFVSTKRAAVAASSTKALYSYGNDSFRTICNEYDECDTPGGSVQVGNSDYTYAGEYGTNAFYPNYSTAIDFNKNTTCRSALLSFAPMSSGFGGSSDFTSYAEVVQTRAKAQSASTAPSTIGSLTVTFDGGPWILNTSGNDDTYNDSVAMNGTFSCYTPTGH